MIFIMIVVTIIGIYMTIHYFLNNMLGFPQLSGSCSANVVFVCQFKQSVEQIVEYPVIWDAMAV